MHKSQSLARKPMSCCSCPNIPMLKEPAKRVRWITRDQTEVLIGLLPDHQQPMMRFALETGLRRSNVTHLEWSQVNPERRMAWIHPDQTKAEKAIGVPLSNEAVVILRGQVGKHSLWVFPYRGKPVTQTATKAWREAVRAAGIASGFFGGTIFGIPGQAGTPRTARH